MLTRRARLRSASVSRGAASRRAAVLESSGEEIEGRRRLELVVGDAGEPLRERPAFLDGDFLAVPIEPELAQRANERGIFDTRDARHPSESRVRRDVRIRIHLENPRLAGGIDAHVHAAVAVTADELPRRQGDAANFGRELRRQIRGTARRGADVLVAADEPLRLIGHDAPLAAGHRTEVDLRDWKDRVAENADVDLPAVDVPLDEHFVPALEHRVDARR